MNFLAAIFNVVLFGFTCLVLMTDGISKEVSYILFTLLMLLVPVLNLVWIIRGANHGWFNFNFKRQASGEQTRKVKNIFSKGVIMNSLVILCNVLIIGFTCLAIVDQYPHPEEDGYIFYISVVFLTPILSSLVIFRNAADIK
jgi:hypothetical protein